MLVDAAMKNPWRMSFTRNWISSDDRMGFRSLVTKLTCGAKNRARRKSFSEKFLLKSSFLNSTPSTITSISKMVFSILEPFVSSSSWGGRADGVTYDWGEYTIC